MPHHVVAVDMSAANSVWRSVRRAGASLYQGASTKGASLDAHRKRILLINR
ncbi:MAG TPA: hypothetical protein VF920_14705 [Dongiaceae bacterium]